MTKLSKDPFLVVISGPTASGKTEISKVISDFFPSQIINADTGQFYTPFSIGTAKPDWKNEKTKHNLFDIVSEPKDISVIEYRKLLLDKVQETHKEKQIPIVVGGSLFYIKSLYFPPIISKEKGLFDESIIVEKDLWQVLNKIDPVRASELHPNDIYRIKRAIEIWHKTGKKPSEVKPKFNPGFNSMFIFLLLDDKILRDRIKKRTEIMIHEQGWIEEVEPFVNTEWENFLIQKGLIGYGEIISWIKEGKKAKDLSDLVNNIVIKTQQYAKRQRVFWKSFKKQLKDQKSNYVCEIKEVSELNSMTLKTITKAIKERLNYSD